MPGLLLSTWAVFLGACASLPEGGGAGTDRQALSALPWTGTFCAVPVINALRIRDDHENPVGGNTAYFYFSEAGAKSGNLYPQVGDQTFDVNAWASNVQGELVVHGDRAQWEFYAGAGFDQHVHGWSHRSYPVIYRNCVNDRSRLQWRNHRVKEDDEWGINDDVGHVRFDTSRCNSQVFDRGLVEGWAEETMTIGYGDVAEVVYRIWCYAPGFGGNLVAGTPPTPASAEESPPEAPVVEAPLYEAAPP